MSNVKLKCTPEQFQMFEGGNQIHTSNGDKYYYLPFWYKLISKTDTEVIVEPYLPDHIPEDLRKVLERNRKNSTES